MSVLRKLEVRESEDGPGEPAWAVFATIEGDGVEFTGPICLLSEWRLNSRDGAATIPMDQLRHVADAIATFLSTHEVHVDAQ